MALIVQKYGGSSVCGPERIRAVAQRVVDTRRAGHEVVVVVSAMGDTTDELLDLASQVAGAPQARELDVLLTAGESVSSALLAIAVNDLGQRACALSGSQAGIVTTGTHGTARIVDVLPMRVRRELACGSVAVVAGFQGVCQSTEDVTTLGRGGSDTTAVALAAALGADVCEIYTDVDGVCTADPRIAPNARLLSRLGYEQMLELAAHGAKVLMPRCVEYARRHRVRVHVRSSYSARPGTLVIGSLEEHKMEQPLIIGVAHDLSEVKFAVTGIPSRTGGATSILRVLADARIELGMVVQNISTLGAKLTDLTLTLPREDSRLAIGLLHSHRDVSGFSSVSCDEQIGRVSLIGTGMRGEPGIAATFCEAMTSVGINVEMLSTSESRISAICRGADVDDAVRALHDAFGLGSDQTAVVYAGTGR